MTGVSVGSLSAGSHKPRHSVKGVGGAGFTAGVLAACASVLALTLTYPMTVDQGVFAHMGEEILQGRWPYLDTWESDFPGLMFLQALEIRIFGKSMVMFRLFDVLWQLVTAWLIFSITSRLTRSRPAGFLAAVLYCLIYQGYGPWNTAQREGFATLFILAGFYAYLTRRRRPASRTALWVGSGLGMAATIKPTLLLLGAIYLPTLVRNGLDDRKSVLFALAGVVLPGLSLLGFFASQGGLRELYEATVAYQDVYSGMIRGDASLLEFWTGNVFELGTTSVLLAAGSVPLIWCGPSRREARMLYLGYLAALVSVVAQGTFAGYHYLPGLAIGSVFVGMIYSTGLRLLPKPSTRRWQHYRRRAESLVIPALLLLAVPAYVDAASVRKLVHGELVAPPPASSYRNDGVFDLEESWHLASYLRTHTDPDDRVQIWGYESLVYYLADRSSASRFHTSHPLVERPAGGDLTEMQQRWRREFMRDVRLHRPQYVMVVRDDTWWWSPGQRSSADLLSDFPAWQRFIEDNYVLECEIGRFLVYRIQNNRRAGG